MSFGSTIDGLVSAAEIARAAYNSSPIPAGWHTLTAKDLKFTPSLLGGYFDGNYFRAGLGSLGAPSAIVLQNGATLALSFTGTDGFLDKAEALQLLGADDTYIAHYGALLSAVAAYAHSHGITNLFVTGHSLGGAAANELRDFGSRYDPIFASAEYITFASAEIASRNEIYNIGFENDPVFKVVNSYGDYLSTTDNVIFGDANYANGYTPNFSAHSINNYIGGLVQLKQSEFFDEITRDSNILIVETNNIITDRDSDHHGTYYIGRDTLADNVLGGAFDDRIEGFGGNDILNGGAGSDIILGGNGSDKIIGGTGADKLYGGAGSDTFMFGTGDVAAGEIIHGGSLLGGEHNTIAGEGSVDFREAYIAAIDSITFTGAGTFHFETDQFDFGGISTDANIRGWTGWEANSAGLPDTISFSVPGSASDGAVFDMSTFKFSNWTSSNVIEAVGGPGNDTITGTRWVDHLFGGGGDDILRGGDGNDQLNGGSGEDILDGGKGNDLLAGGDGSDTYYIDSVLDKVIENPNEGIGDTVSSSIGGSFDIRNVENFQLSAPVKTLLNLNLNEFKEIDLSDGSDNLRLYANTSEYTLVTIHTGDGADMIRILPVVGAKTWHQDGPYVYNTTLYFDDLSTDDKIDLRSFHYSGLITSDVDLKQNSGTYLLGPRATITLNAGEADEVQYTNNSDTINGFSAWTTVHLGTSDPYVGGPDFLSSSSTNFIL